MIDRGEEEDHLRERKERRREEERRRRRRRGGGEERRRQLEKCVYLCVCVRVCASRKAVERGRRPRYGTKVREIGVSALYGRLSVFVCATAAFVDVVVVPAAVIGGGGSVCVLKKLRDGCGGEYGGGCA